MNKNRKKAIYILAIAAGVSTIAFVVGVFINKKNQASLNQGRILKATAFSLSVGIL